MQGNTINEFLNDLLTVGGPEKEFTFRGKKYFLETTQEEGSTILDLSIQEFLDRLKNLVIIKKHIVKIC